LEIEMNSWKNS